MLLGGLLLAFGRRLFWLFVGAVGFVAGARFAERFLPNQPDDVIIIFCLVVGLLSAVLAVTLRKIALGVAGFLAGGYLLTQLLSAGGQLHMQFAGAHGDFTPWMAFLVGGLAGALLMNAVFNWTLIVLSSLGGAAIICESLRTSPQIVSAVFTVLAILGVVVHWIIPASNLHFARKCDCRAGVPACRVMTAAL